MLQNKLVDGVIQEPIGGAHHDPAQAYEFLKEAVMKEFATLKNLSIDELVASRINKFSDMGVVVEG